MSTSQDHELEQWLRASRTDEAARARRRSAIWRQLGPTDADLVGVLLDLSERGTETTIELTNGHAHRGRILEVAPSWLLLAKTSGELALCRSRCIASIEGSDRQLSFGSRSTSVTTGFTAAVERMAMDRFVTMWSGTSVLRGELHQVGEEIAVMTSEARNRRYVSLDAVDEVIVSARC
jgi:hypothetical protein